MKIFKITQNIEVVCDWKKTRYGFKHEATLFKDGREVDKAKCCYYNRTWERYEYQSVLIRVIETSAYLSEEEKKVCLEYAEGDHTDWSGFKLINSIAKMGELLCDNQKDKNDWKARMLKAGLESQGLEMPEDWASLDEDTKEARLNLVMKQLDRIGEKHDK